MVICLTSNIYHCHLTQCNIPRCFSIIYYFTMSTPLVFERQYQKRHPNFIWCLILYDVSLFLLVRPNQQVRIAGIYLLKVNNGNTRPMCKTCSKLAIKTPERRQWRRSCVFVVNFEQILHIVLVSLLLILNKSITAGIDDDNFYSPVVLLSGAFNLLMSGVH